MDDRTAFRVAGGKDEFFNPREADRTGAHRTRLESDIEMQSAQPIIADLFCGSSERLYFGVRSRVMIGDRLIVAIGNNFPRLRINDHRTDWDFAACSSIFRQLEGAEHRVGGGGHLFPIAP